MKKPERHFDLDKIMKTDLPDRAVARGVREALVLHKKLGLPVAVEGEGGRGVRWIPPDEIEIPPEIPPAMYQEEDDP